ncbi:MAG: tetratricopeptide repeat protein, partial [Candidatus Omnitrophica bacterium]|nr:tetratricopeptide repeat protein [Candidatus Omnitrophota bacterium]
MRYMRYTPGLWILFATVFLLSSSYPALSAAEAEIPDATQGVPSSGPKPSTVSVPTDERFNFADGLYSRNMYDMAATEYENLIQAHPDHPRTQDAWFRLAECLFFLKRYEPAISRYQQFIQTFPSHKQVETARLRLGEILDQTGKKDEALRQFQTLTQSASPLVQRAAVYYAGKMFYEKQNWGEAEKQFRSLANVEGENPFAEIANYHLAEIAFRSERYEDATASFQKLAASEKPTLKQLGLFGLGKTSFHTKQYDQAAGFFRQASEIQANPDVSEDAFVNYLNALYESERYADLLESYGKIPMSQPKRMISVKLLLANTYLQMKQYPEALKVFDEILTIPETTEKDREMAELGKLSTLLIQGQAGGALQAFSSMKQERSFFKDRWISLEAEMMKKNGRLQEAVKLLDSLIQDFPESPYFKQALLNRGSIFLDLGKNEEARADFETFVQKFSDDPLTPKTLMNIIALDIKLGYWQDGVKDSAVFLEKYPQSPDTEQVLFQLGSIHLELGDYDKAFQTYERVFNQYPASAKKEEILFSLGY